MSWAKDQGSKSAGARTKTPGAAGGLFRSRRDATGLGSLEDVPGIIAALSAVAFAGDAVTIGLTSDSGAWCVTVLHDREQSRDYPHSQDELNETFEQICQHYLPVRKLPDVTK